MGINLILLVFCLFVIRTFFFLAKKYDKYLFLYSLLGVLIFLLNHFVFTIICNTLFLAAFDKIALSDIVMSCFTIPMALIISGLCYKFLEMRFKKNKGSSEIKDLGKTE